MKKKIGEMFVQIIPVMVGVYLAFLVTEWTDRNQRRTQSKFLIENLIKEIETNDRKLKNVLGYHRMLRALAHPTQPRLLLQSRS